MRRLVIAGALLGLVAFACSVSFNPDGQPCAPDGGCLTSPVLYTCQAGFCRLGETSGASSTTGRATSSSSSGSASSSGSHSSSSSGSSHASTSGSSSSGGVGCTPACTASEICLETDHTCVARTCANLRCSFLDSCVSASDGGAECVARPDAGLLGTNTPCASNADCHTVGYFCLYPLHSLAGVSGLCTATCATSVTCKGTDTCDTAVAQGRGGLTGLCFTQPPASCTNAATCASFGLACTEFDGASQANLPVPFCDVAEQGAVGQFCTVSTACQTGLCVGLPDAGGTCLAPCQAAGDCTFPQVCTLVTPLDASGNAPACVTPPATRCSACATSATCGLDAPTCNALSNHCDLACNATANEPCGSGTSCGANGLCAFDAGLCE